MSRMRVLVACEYSGTVRDAFAARGHEAWSCDFEPPETPGNHRQCDVLEMINDGWDLMVAHPPCERLCVSGARWKYEKAGWVQEQESAIEFVKKLLAAPVEKIALENPIGIISSQIRKPDQVLQPWMFGYPETKAMCFWLKNLPVLMFLSPDGRAKLLSRLRSTVRRGGAIVIFDKCVSAGGYAGTVMSRLTLASKLASGVPAQQIIEKELSLMGVQRPLYARELDFATEFFRYGDFAGWLVEAMP